MKYVALCCIAKDEDLFLKEWLAYHSLLGFEHFLIYDNNSARPIAETLAGFAGPDRLTVLRSGEERSQLVAYTHCLAAFGHDFKWIAFLDLDEFIRITPDGGSLPDVRELLAPYEPYAGLGLNWRMFSSSGHEKRPDGLVIENYTRYYEDNVHIKSIVQPEKTDSCAGPHSFYPLPGHCTVNADHFPVPGGFPACVPAVREACVNHYYFKSRQCFQTKIDRGNPCNIVRRMEEFDQHLNLPGRNDCALLPFADRLRGALAAGRLPLPEAPAFARAPAGGAETAQQEEPDVWLFLKAAREHCKNGRLRQARLCLCRAALCAEDGAAAGEGRTEDKKGRETNTPDSFAGLELWTLRAIAARKGARLDLAEYFLRHAFTRGAGAEACAELANVMLNTGRHKEAGQLVGLLKLFSRNM